MATNFSAVPGDREAAKKSPTATIYLGDDPRFSLRCPSDEDSVILSNLQDPAQSCRIPAKLLFILAETLLAIRKKRAPSD